LTALAVYTADKTIVKTN